MAKKNQTIQTKHMNILNAQFQLPKLCPSCISMVEENKKKYNSIECPP